MDFLFQKRDAKILGYLRIIIGSWLFVDWFGMMIIGYVDEAYISSQFNFTFIGFDWVRPLPAFGMYLVFSIGALMAVFITLGIFYRWALAIFFFLQLYVFMLDVVYTLNKFYLFLILVAVLFVVPAHRSLSLLVKWQPIKKLTSVSSWQVLVFQFMLLMIYFYSGLSKLTTDWIQMHEPLHTFLKYKWPFSILNDASFDKVVALMSYGGLTFDLTVWFWLTNRKTRWFANIWQTSFHSINFLFLGVGSLSIYMSLLTWLMFPPEALLKRLKIKNKKGHHPALAQNKRRVTIAIGIVAIVMLLIPHRHFLIDNNVNWTEKGHRFSWRLMTRTKSGSSSYFKITDNKTKEVWGVEPADYLTRRQYRKMSAETDLVIQFAHWLEDQWLVKGHSDVKVSAIVNTRLNSRPAILLIDPELDLTKVERTIWSDEVSTKGPFQ